MAKKSIGEANVKLTVEGAEKVASKLKDVKGELESTADASKSAGSKINEVFGGVGRSIEGATEGVRKFAGSLTGILGIVGAIGAIAGFVFGGLIEKFKESKEKADNLTEAIKLQREALREVADDFVSKGEKLTVAEQIEKEAADAIKALDEQSKDATDKLQKRLDAAGSWTTGVVMGLKSILAVRNINDLGSEQLAELEKDAKEVYERIAIDQQRIIEERDARLKKLEEEQLAESEKIAADAAEEKAKKQEQIESALVDQLETVRINALEGADRIEAEYQRRRADRERAYQEAVEEGRQREAELLDAIDRQDAQNTQNAIARIKEQEQARADAERDRQQKEQQRQEDAAARELAAALRETQRALAEQAKAINENSREVRGLRERVFNFTPDIRRVAENTSRRTR